MNLPVTLLAFSLSQKIVNQLRLFLYLKCISSGHIRLDKKCVARACNDLQIKSSKTFYKNLNWLITNRWITVNSKRKSYRLVSIDRLCHRFNLSSRTGVEVDISDLNNFRPLIYAAVYAWSIRKKNWIQRQPERKKGRSRKSMLKIHGQLPNRYLAKILDLDHSTISRYKLSATQAGYLANKHNYESTELPEKFMYILKEGSPEDAHLFVMYQKIIHRQLCDSITAKIILKHRRIRSP